MVLVLYAEISEPWDQEKLLRYYNLIPGSEVDKICKFRRWQDLHLSLGGKLLLLKGMQTLGRDATQIQGIKRNAFDKPYFDFDLFFNISHSNNFVVCAMSNETKIGVDIEAIADINYRELKWQWCEDEWNSINSSDEPLKMFYKYWTRKEALIKADGKGMSLTLKDINTCNDVVDIEGKYWYVQDVSIAENYLCHIATEKKVTSVNKEKVLL